MATAIKKVIVHPKMVVGGPPAEPVWKVQIDDAFAKAQRRFDKAAVKTAKLGDGLLGYQRRSDKIQARLDAEVAAIQAAIGVPVAKRKTKTVPMAVQEDCYEEEDDDQPSQLGPQVNRQPSRAPDMEKKEALLQKAADEYCAGVMQKGHTPGDQFAQNRSLFKRYNDGLFSGRVRPSSLSAQPTAVIDDTYVELMKRAEHLADRTGRTIAQEFSDLYEKRAKPPANSDETDDDQVAADVGSGDMDDEDTGPELGHRVEPAASTSPQGSSVGDYEHEGHPRMTNSRSMAGGTRTEGSYDPRKRPRSATRRRM
jgi:hypothetical protein